MGFEWFVGLGLVVLVVCLLICLFCGYWLGGCCVFVFCLVNGFKLAVCLWCRLCWFVGLSGLGFELGFGMFGVCMVVVVGL